MLGALIATGALSACVVAPHSDAGPYPKFSDIPLKAASGTSADKSKSEGAILQGMAAKLTDQAAGVSAQKSDADALNAARVAASGAPAPTEADAAATEAYARAARARATPPPPRKK